MFLSHYKHDTFDDVKWYRHQHTLQKQNINEQKSFGVGLSQHQTFSVGEGFIVVTMWGTTLLMSFINIKATLCTPLSISQRSSSKVMSIKMDAWRSALLTPFLLMGENITLQIFTFRQPIFVPPSLLLTPLSTSLWWTIHHSFSSRPRCTGISKNYTQRKVDIFLLSHNLVDLEHLSSHYW